MKKNVILLFLTVLVFSFFACKKEKKTSVNTNIIVPPREVVVPDTIIHTVNATDFSDTVSWVGSVYKMGIHRYTNDTLSVVTDADGRRYRNNLVKVTVTRADGSVFFERVFRKSMFEDHITKEYAQRCVLLGVVFDSADRDNLIFKASVGSPDELSEDFVTFDVIISRMGDVTIRKSELDEKPAELEEDSDSDGV